MHPRTTSITSTPSIATRPMTTERGLRAGPDAALAFLLVLCFSDALSAHRRDEYLQAARIDVEPNRVDVELDLTPGIEVADSWIDAIDRDRDGRLSDGERQKFVARAVEALALDVDGRALRMQSTASTFPDLDAIR